MAWNTDETGFIVLLDKNRTQVISLKYENVFKISNYYIQEINYYKRTICVDKYYTLSCNDCGGRQNGKYKY